MKKTVYKIKNCTWRNCESAYKRVWEQDGRYYIKCDNRLWDVTDKQNDFFYCK